MWRIRLKNRYFWMLLIIPIITIVIIIFTQVMLLLLMSGILKGSYSRFYSFITQLSISNAGFAFISPLIALVSIALLIFKKITLLEFVINFVINASMPFLFLYVVVKLNGGI